MMFKGSESPDNPDALYNPPTVNTDSMPVKQQKTWQEVVKNKRAQYYLKLRDRCYNTYRAVIFGEYYDPDEMISFSSDIIALSLLRSELCRMPIKPNNNGKFELYTKIEMKSAKFKLPSPNVGDCVMMLMRVQAVSINKPAKMPRALKRIGDR